MKHISWDETDAAASALVAQITASGFKPDFLVGITTGGLIPLTLLAKRLGVSDVLTIYAKSYDKESRKELIIKYRPNVDLKNKNVLIVDEIADSGETLRAISNIFADEYGALVKTAVLVRKDTCPYPTDFSAITHTGDEWLVFPWEKNEI